MSKKLQVKNTLMFLKSRTEARPPLKSKSKNKFSKIQNVHY